MLGFGGALGRASAVTTEYRRALADVCNLLKHYTLVPVQKPKRKRKRYVPKLSLSEQFINFDLRKTAFQKRLKKNESFETDAQYFKWALDKYDSEKLAKGLPMGEPEAPVAKPYKLFRP